MKLHFTKEWLEKAIDSEVGYELYPTLVANSELLSAAIGACAVAQEACAVSSLIANDNSNHLTVRKIFQEEARDRSAKTRRLLFAIIDHRSSS